MKTLVATDGPHEEAGKIKAAFLGFEDHNIFTFMLDIDFGGSGQGFGHYAIKQTAGVIIPAILEACGVRSWDQVEGRVILAIRDEPYGLIRGIKPMPFEKGTGFRFDDEGEIVKL